jgi:hypothetical protein
MTGDGPEWAREEARRRGIDVPTLLAEMQGFIDGRPRPPRPKEEDDDGSGDEGKPE